MANLRILFEKVSSPRPGTTYPDIEVLKEIRLIGRRLGKDEIKSSGYDPETDDVYYVRRKRTNPYGPLYIAVVNRYDGRRGYCYQVRPEKYERVTPEGYNNIVVIDY